jgi:hypothetical protein
MEQRGERVATTFWITVEGVDTVPVLREGDVSVTGVRFDTDTDVGDAGNIRTLTIRSPDGVHCLRIVAEIARSIGTGDGRRVHVAFEFLPDSAIATDALRHFVEHALATRRDRPSSVRPRLTALQRDFAASADEADREARSEEF